MKEELLKRLDALAVKLGTTIDHLWAVLIMQAKITIIEDLLRMLLFGIGIVVLWRVFKWLIIRQAAARELSKYDGESHIVGMAVCAIAMASLGGICIYELTELPTLILNPQYWALQKIWSFLH